MISDQFGSNIRMPEKCVSERGPEKEETPRRARGYVRHRGEETPIELFVAGAATLNMALLRHLTVRNSQTA